MANDFKIKLDLRTVEDSPARTKARVDIKRLIRAARRTRPSTASSSTSPARTISIVNPDHARADQARGHDGPLSAVRHRGPSPAGREAPETTPAKLLRNPKKREAGFTRFQDLPSGWFGALTRLLRGSPNVRLLTGTKK